MTSSSNGTQSENIDGAIGPYDILSMIGEGGMGKVFRARHRDLDKEFALKVIHSHLLGNDGALQRFRREIQAASSLTHVNLVAVFTDGQTEKGSPFMVMDLVDGTSLADILKREGFLGLPRALDLFAQICDALIHAHMKGVIHRDSKPSNILLSKGENGAELVKILDFGIAKILDSNDGSGTQTGEVFGSPSYMSPEQCLGKAIDSRSDIYSLGCIMYETLSGKPPFAGKNPIQTIMQQINDPARRFRNDLNIPRDLETLVFETLQKEPDARYQSMEQLGADLYRVMHGQSLERQPTSNTSALPRRPVKRRPQLFFPAILIFIVAVSINCGITAWLNDDSLKPPFLEGSGNSYVYTSEPKPTRRIEIRDVHGKLLYAVDKARDLNQVVCEAVQRGVDLTGADFSKHNLNDVSLLNASLPGADFTGAKLTRVKFDASNLNQARFSGAQFNECYFENCSLMNANFSNATSYKAAKQARNQLDHDTISFRSANLINADFSHVVFTNASFDGSLTRAKFNGAKLEKSGFSHANLTDVDFRGASLSNGCLCSTILSGARFEGADLTSVDAYGATDANFAGSINRSDRRPPR